MINQKASANSTATPAANAKADIMKAAGDAIEEVPASAKGENGDSLVQKKGKKH